MCVSLERNGVYERISVSDDRRECDKLWHKKTQNEQANKKKKKKKRRIYCFGDLEQITEIVPFSVTLGLLVRLKMKESL